MATNYDTKKYKACVLKTNTIWIVANFFYKNIITQLRCLIEIILDKSMDFLNEVIE